MNKEENRKQTGNKDQIFSNEKIKQPFFWEHKNQEDNQIERQEENDRKTESVRL